MRTIKMENLKMQPCLCISIVQNYISQRENIPHTFKNN